MNLSRTSVPRPAAAGCADGLRNRYACNHVQRMKTPPHSSGMQTLGHDGPLPATRAEASDLIEQLKAEQGAGAWDRRSAQREERGERFSLDPLVRPCAWRKCFAVSGV